MHKRGVPAISKRTLNIRLSSFSYNELTNKPHYFINKEISLKFFTGTGTGRTNSHVPQHPHSLTCKRRTNNL
jgi:hypothetical protein